MTIIISGGRAIDTDGLTEADLKHRSLEQSLPHYTPEARARREMLMAAIKSETELYRSRIANYERELQEIEKAAVAHAVS